jgi:hypothetical protein
MVHFGKRLLALRYEPWKEHYIDYNKLKRILESDEVDSSAATALQIKDEFQKELDSNIETAVLFSLQEQGKVAQRLAVLKDARLELHVAVHVQLAMASTSDGGTTNDIRIRIHDLLKAYREVGEIVLQLVKFTEMNLTGVRKILKKHDRLYHFHKLGPKYFTESSLHWDGKVGPDRHLNHLLHYEGVGPLVATLQQAFAELNGWEHALDTKEFARPRRNLTEPDLSLALMGPSDSFLPKNPKQMIRQTSRSRTTTNLMGLPQEEAGSSNSSRFRFPKEPILFRIQAARNRLYESSRFVQFLAAPAMFPEHEGSERDGSMDMQVAAAQTPRSRMSNILNLLSTFLYLTNYYIAAPTSGSYAAKLDGSEALAGIVIGMTSFAALAGTLLYSWWTNYSYKVGCHRPNMA